MEVSPQKLVVPPDGLLKVIIRNPTEDLQNLRLHFDSFYFMVNFGVAEGKQHGETPSCAYCIHELQPGETYSLTIVPNREKESKTTTQETEISVTPEVKSEFKLESKTPQKSVKKEPEQKEKKTSTTPKTMPIAEKKKVTQETKMEEFKPMIQNKQIQKKKKNKKRNPCCTIA
ncbi:hypothetical protein CRE_13619 [Caenorhabditis remanei]|uniref:Uncharacterized protein n=1 Tax=Caenorhabditis remanei TaxID=31234 RepID=E3N1A9_CAERE|nr:hypothetical protein CRE_13619 [Caenorhabditis remanei]